MFLDSNFKITPKKFSEFLTVSVYCREKKLFVPIIHFLMQSCHNESFNYIFGWIKDTYNLNPTFITCDIDENMMKSV